MSALLATVAQIAVLVGLVVAVAYYLKLDPMVTKVAIGVGIFAVFVVTILNFVRRLKIPSGKPVDPAKAARKQAKKQLREEAKVLRVRFRELVRHLRRGQDGLGVRYSEARDRRAWWAVIGARGHGKSTLLSSAPEVEEIAGAEAEGPRFFVTPTAVFVELPADYDRRPGAALAFPTFLRALRRLRRAQPIDGVLMVHRVDALLADDEDSVLVADARRQIDRLAKGLDVQVPVIVAGAQLDALPGLAEICADREHVDASRALGIALPARLTGQATAETANSHFDARGGPVEWVRDRCFTLVASCEGGHRSQARLFGFWQSFRELGARAADVAGLLSAARLPGGDPLPLRGIYFTAAGTGEHTNAVDPCLARMAREVGGELTGGGSSGPPGVFTSEFLAHELRRAGGYGRRSRPYRRRRVILHAVGAALVVSVGVYMAVGMTASAEGNVRLLQSTSEKAFGVEQSGARIPEAGEVRSYASLLKSVDDWSGGPPEGLGWGLFRADLVKDAVTGTARASVCRGVVAPAVLAVEAKLNNFVGAFAEGGVPGGERRGEVLAWLRFYLMLSEGDDTACLSPPERPWRPESARGEITKIIGMQGAHLNPLLESYADTVGVHLRDVEPGRVPDVCVRSRGAKAVERKVPLVESVREILNRESGEGQLVDDLIAAINKDGTPFKLATNSGRVKSRHRLQVAPAFTKRGWLEFANLLSRRLGNSAAGDGWALCRAGVGSAEDRCELAADIYVAKYEDAWRGFVEGVWIDSPSSISEAIAIYRDLLNEAPLDRFWKAVDMNTRGLGAIQCMAPGSPTPAGQSLAESWLAIAKTLKTDVGKADSPTMKHARKVEAGFHGFSSFGIASGEAAEASVTALSKYHKRLGELRAAADQANQNRERHQELVAAMEVALEDIKTSLRNELGGWDGEIKGILMPPLESLNVAVMEGEAERLNEMWCEEVVKPMRRSLAQKYPFDAQARLRGKLDDVDIIFHPANGAIAKFRDDKLSAYVEQLGNQVVARELGVDAKYHPSAALIELLNASHQLGTLLFPDEQAEISFELTMECTGQLARVELSLDGEVVTYLCGREQAKRITWPGEGDEHEASLELKGQITRADKGDVYKRPGDFAILELMDRKLSPKRDSATGLISLSVDARKNDLGVLRMTVLPDQVPGGGDIFYGFGGKTFLAPFRSPRFLNPPTSLFNEVSFSCGGEGSSL